MTDILLYLLGQNYLRLLLLVSDCRLSCLQIIEKTTLAICYELAAGSGDDSNRPLCNILRSMSTYSLKYARSMCLKYVRSMCRSMREVCATAHVDSDVVSYRTETDPKTFLRSSVWTETDSHFDL